MIKQKPLEKEHYESLIGMIRYGECRSEEIDKICKYALSRPADEKKFFDLFDRYRRFTPQNSFSCVCVDQIIFKITQVINNALNTRG